MKNFKKQQDRSHPDKYLDESFVDDYAVSEPFFPDEFGYRIDKFGIERK